MTDESRLEEGYHLAYVVLKIPSSERGTERLVIGATTNDLLPATLVPYITSKSGSLLRPGADVYSTGRLCAGITCSRDTADAL